MLPAAQEADIRAQWRSGKPSFVLFSSGSTGAPSAYTLSRRLMEWSAAQTGAALKVQASDRIFCCLPLDKVGGLMQVIRSESWNIPLLAIQPALHPMQYLEAHHPFSITSLTGSQLNASLGDAAEIAKLRRFRVVLAGGEALSAATEQTALDAGIQLWHTYGMTETASHIALRRAGTKGFIPFPGVALERDARDGHLIIDIPGILEQPLHTRDVAVLETDGSFRILGRLDTVINSGGMKIQAEAVEQIIDALQLLHNRAFVVAGAPDATWGEAVVLLVEGDPFPLKPKQLKEAVNERIPYGAPKSIRFIPKLPRTDSGKISRHEVQKLLHHKHSDESV
jgi:O-succinylbenzoic acid--CoA ligase